MIVADKLSPVLAATNNAAQAAAPTAEERKAARDFEAILLRKMLSALEKTSQVGAGKGFGASGTSAYSSFVVGALGDVLAEAGGIGLQAEILRSMRHDGQKGGAEIGPIDPQGFQTVTVHGPRKDPK